MAIAVVGSVRSAIQAGLNREAASLLGGDASLEFTYRFADEIERAWMAENATAVSEVVDFRSMVSVAGNGSEGERALVQVKAIDDLYPLYGMVGLTGVGSLAEALARRDGVPGMIAHRVLVERLQISLGETLSLGTQNFVLTAVLDSEPDGVGSGFSFGPRVIVASRDLADSGLLLEGSLFETEYRLKLPQEADLAALEDEANERFLDTGMRWRDSRNGTPQISQFVDRLSAFFILLGLAGLAVGGVGVSAAVRSYLDGKTETIATLKTLGAGGSTVFGIYLAQVGLLSSIGILIGVILGASLPVMFSPLIADRFPVPVDFGFYWRPLAEATFYGLMSALIFTLWPLARSRELRAASLYRDLAGHEKRLPQRRYIILILVLVCFLIATATLLSGTPTIALSIIGGMCMILAILFCMAMLARAAARSLSRQSVARGRPSLRLALGAVGGPSAETAQVIMSLGLSLSVLAAVGQIDWNLRNIITADLPQRAPSYFFVDIQDRQLEEFTTLASGETGVSDIQTAPMLRGIITRINGLPAQEVVGDHWALRGDRGITYASSQPAGATLTAGTWWPDDYSGPPLLSFAAEEGEELGLQLGDEITMNILGRDLTAEIANFREVEFEDMGINFLMVVNADALAGAPHTHIATVYSSEAAEAPLLRKISGQLPNVTGVGVREAIDQFSNSLAGLTEATRWAAAATLLTGIVVLIGAAAAGERRRLFEAAVLKAIGVTRRRILASFALRSAIIGLTAGLIAVGAGALGGWSVTTFVMDYPYTFEPVSATLIVVGGASISVIAGLAFAYRSLSMSPAFVLRSRE